MKRSHEDSARIFRYHELRRICLRHDFYCATGHHSKDYIESLLINLIRGAGPSALQTLKPIYQNVFRPLLYMSEAERNTFLQENHVPIFEDESNAEEKYLRNRLRKNVIPHLYQEGLDPGKVYFNFHEEGLGLDLQESSQPFLQIHKASLITSSLGKLKDLLDANISLLSLYPLGKKFFLHLAEKIRYGGAFTMENRQLIFWRAYSSDLYLIPRNSPCLQAPRMLEQSGSHLLVWNQQKREYSKEYSLQIYEKGLKIKVAGMHKRVKELMREREIPIPVRKNIPILLGKDSIPVSILFSFWKEKLTDFPRL
ncbi:MAG: tRNA lysidine(34) synthetase TilS [Spirochaetota bacterium]